MFGSPDALLAELLSSFPVSEDFPAVGSSDDIDEEDAEEVEGWTLDDDEEGDGGVSIFKFKGKYLEL